jgi:ABC-type hemin transport system ATPase subunit
LCGIELVERVYLESEAFIEIADVALRGKIVIVSSDYVKFEIEKIVDPLKRKDVRGFERTLASVNVASSKQIISLARVLCQMWLKSFGCITRFFCLHRKS